MTLPTGWIRNLLGFFATGNGVTGEKHVNNIVVGDGLSLAVNDATRTGTLTTTRAVDMPQWRTKLSLDFTTQTANWPNTSNPKIFTADGQYFLDDFLPVVFQNFAYLNSSDHRWSIVNGQGLVMTPQAVGAGAPARTLPKVIIRLGNCDAISPTRVRASFTTPSDSDASAILELAWTSSTNYYSIEAWGNSPDGITSLTEIHMHRQSALGALYRVTVGELVTNIAEGGADTLGIWMPNGLRPLLPALAQMGQSGSGAMAIGDIATDALHEFIASPGNELIEDRLVDTRAAYCYLVLSTSFGTVTATDTITLKNLVVEQYY